MSPGLRQRLARLRTFAWRDESPRLSDESRWYTEHRRPIRSDRKAPLGASDVRGSIPARLTLLPRKTAIRRSRQAHDFACVQSCAYGVHLYNPCSGAEHPSGQHLAHQSNARTQSADGPTAVPRSHRARHEENALRSLTAGTARARAPIVRTASANRHDARGVRGSSGSPAVHRRPSQEAQACPTPHRIL